MLPTDTDFEAKFTFENGGNQLDEEPPFHILVLGDWSANAEKIDLLQRRPIVIDRDNFDEVLRESKTTLALDLTGDGKLLNLEFKELDDFHPDNIFRQVSLFADLRDIRRRLRNADDFDEAARQVRAWFNISDEIEIFVEREKTSPVSSDNLLDQILSSPAETSSANPRKVDNSELGIFLSKIVSPHLVKIDET
nr:type VI secretion system contractile sheath small subunit [Pyrinomonadaceae bacterium]